LTTDGAFCINVVFGFWAFAATAERTTAVTTTGMKTFMVGHHSANRRSITQRRLILREQQLNTRLLIIRYRGELFKCVHESQEQIEQAG
jgi:hypothetical protein